MTHDPDRDFDPGLLHRYLAGCASRQETDRFERWVAEDPEREARLAEFRKAFEVVGQLDLGESLPRFDPDAAWAKMDRAPLRLVVDRSSTSTHTIQRVAIAAGILLAVGAATWLARGRALPLSTQHPARSTSLATRAGQRADLYLSDGTHVILGAKSRLRYASPLNAHSRDVFLDGEALFDVKHDPKRPFLVRTAHAITEDLGTTFAMRAYAVDSTVTVAVAEGKVALRRAGGSATVLERGDVGRLAATGEIEATHGASLEPYMAWAEGRLVFRETPLRDVVAALDRWYDLDIRLSEPSAADWHVTATFNGDPAREMMQMLAGSIGLDAKWETSEKIVTLTPRSLPLPTPGGVRSDATPPSP